MSLTALIDYNSGNLHSAHKAFEKMALEGDAGEVVVTSDADVVARADRIVLPGDGAFPACMRELKNESGLFEALKESVEVRATPFLGICVGMQLMASWGREFEDTAGLGWIAGEVVPIQTQGASLKVPHMGWNALELDNQHPVFQGITSGDHAYFVHSFYLRVSDPKDRIAHVDYGADITAVVGRDTMVGTQFHPEKSAGSGLQMISNFLNWRP